MIENWNQKYMSKLTEWNRNIKAHYSRSAGDA